LFHQVCETKNCAEFIKCENHYPFIKKIGFVFELLLQHTLSQQFFTGKVTAIQS